MNVWVADPTIPWRILLTATVPDLGDDASLDHAAATLAAAQGWTPPPPLRVSTDLDVLRRQLTLAQTAPFVLGRAGSDLVVSADHAAVDGLGLLRVLAALGAGPVTSSARGVAERPCEGGAVAAVARRLREAAFTPPAGITPEPPADPHAAGDVMVEARLPRSCRTADLVHAAARAVVAHESARGRGTQHLAVAVGASRAPAADDQLIRDRSALLRLRDVELLDRAGIDRALRSAPLQTPPVAATGGRGAALLGRAAAASMGLLAPRLGSTLLVSHLGEVDAPHVAALSFHPVTAGGTGISLGAVGHDGHTVVSLRARASRWNDDGLEQLLEAVISLL